MKENLKPIIQEIEIPEGVEAEIEGNLIRAKKGDKEICRKISGVSMEKKENKIILKIKRSTKREKKQINSDVAHIKNIFNGLDKNFVYKLQICAVHFPMSVSVQGKELVIKNFLGEAKERRANLLPNVDVKVDGEFITVESCDIEAAGQTAANIEKRASSKKKDKRVFQDGIFMVEKTGVAI